MEDTHGNSHAASGGNSGGGSGNGKKNKASSSPEQQQEPAGSSCGSVLGCFAASKFASIAGAEGNHLSEEQLTAIREGTCERFATSLIDSGGDTERKRIGKKGLHVCLVRGGGGGDFIVMPGKDWVSMRMRANVHVVQFANVVADLKAQGHIPKSAVPVVLLTGGPDSADSKQTGQALCPGAGPRVLKERGLLLQRTSS